ncbi:hypothetical protein L1987_17998 [Smallanthus sonchifolius]|uniref:Uncharacterized protein n=1 Tax=Smallanthus sonchifolius TaxID=185202 RepID=A0ACB9IYJ1_9ASTR|nr:hypothetical protein L1987_17998 [Smallanthus sonchifolius]
MFLLLVKREKNMVHKVDLVIIGVSVGLAVGILLAALVFFGVWDVQNATKNFTTVLGQGSFGPVYKAVMPAGEIVAVKALASDSKQGEKEFQTEVADFGLSKEEINDDKNSCVKAMSSDGADEILDKKLAGECDLEEVRSLARIAHRCLHKAPRKRPTIGEVSQDIKKLKHKHIMRSESRSTMSFGGQEFSDIMGWPRLATESVKTNDQHR